MVAQCKNCQMKFKFDETLIEGEGIWVRCNQCKNVFFLPNPAAAAEPNSGKENAPGAENVNESDSEGKTGAQGRIITEQRENAKSPKTAAGTDKEVGDIDKFKSIDTEDMRNDNRPDRDKIPKSEDAGKKPVAPKGRQLVYLLIVLLIGGVYFTFFAESGWYTAIEKAFGINKKSEEVGPAQVDLTDVRQRFVNNLTMGTIRVLEGNAINHSSFPMTRIKVRGEVTDAYTVVLGVKESYCGNLLNSDELANMTEDQIQKELSNPQGSDVSNDRIMPQGQIPFMIVFTREPAGVVKAFAVPVGAERLLP